MESLFTFFFKYRPFFFQKGDFAFQWGLPAWQLVLLPAAAGAAIFLLYRRRWLGLEGRPRWVLTGLRAGLFLLLLVLLMRPSLVLSTLVPKENLLALLVDNSRSMGIQDNGVTRGRKVAELLASGSKFLEALEEKFYLRSFRFAAQAERVEGALPLDWSGDQTNLTAALESVLAETKNLPLGAVVLFSDGSDNSYRDFKEVLAELQVRKIPVHTVGAGPESFSRDVELTQISAPRLLIPESVALARITFRQRGFGGSRGRLEVREGSSLVQTKEIVFPRDSETLTTELKLIPKSEGIKTYQFHLIPLQGEQIRENNTRSTLLQVKNLKPRVLYVEGHPRWEYKFIRQALADDKNIRLETLLRTALNKFYRQGIEDETTLAAGFPSAREELFSYRAMIFGSVESSFFSYPQMEMIRDFVGKRGGGFLMLGGSASFAAGKYQNTPIEEILPVWLHDPGEPSTAALYAQGDGQFNLSEYGRRHPALQLSLEDQENTRQWTEMPELKDWNIVRGTKSGATVLAHGDFQNQRAAPLLVFQRYGRGQSLALLTSSSWRWQMLQDHKNQSHETFWRQILRWMVNSAQDPVTVETEREIYSQNERVRIRAEINNKAFNRINDARARALITAPAGDSVELPLQWSGREDGVYVGHWTAQEDGLYEISVEAEGKSLSDAPSYGRASTFFLCSTGSREFFDAVQKKDFLQKLARETGGNYYPLSDVKQLPEEIVYTPSRSSVIETLDLWDMPINLILLIGLLIGEWLVRKHYGLV